MRRFLLLLTVLTSFAVLGQDKYYADKTEQEALKKAYKIIKVYYPTTEVCASDTLFDIDRFGSAPIDNEERNRLYLYRLNRKFTFDTPSYSTNVATLLQTDTCKCNDPQYFAEFSNPYKGYIVCYIMPKGRIVGAAPMSKDPDIAYFVFKYDDSGEIYQVKIGTLFFD